MADGVRSSASAEDGEKRDIGIINGGTLRSLWRRRVMGLGSGGQTPYLATERDCNGPHLFESVFPKAPPSQWEVELFLGLCAKR